MSRFSRKTATGLGYLLFAMMGGAGYWILKSDSAETKTIAMEDRPKLNLQITLGPSIQNAEELSSMAVPGTFHDPIIDLSSSRKPAWVDHRGMVPIESLVNQGASRKLPTEYPYGHVKPIAVPRSGNAIYREPSTTLMSLAPSAQHLVRSTGVEPSRTVDNSTDAIPMVPINRSAPGSGLNEVEPEVANATLEAPAPTLSWHEKSLQTLKEIGAAMMAPPPPQSVINNASKANSQQYVSSAKPVVDSRTAASDVVPASSIQTAEPRWQSPSASGRSFIIQPNH